MSRHRKRIPALFPVTHKPFATGAVDDYGNPAESWGAGTVKRFITWAAFDSSEPSMAGHDRDVVTAGIVVYPDFGEVSPRDRIVIDGDLYEVIGHPERADKSWFDTPVENWVINLKAVNG